ncbi:MAG: geranylgeranyl reductase family protein [Candidatus Diapherotrites archaeon]
MKQEFDAIIVGAGPAGSSCACFLGMQGIHTLLLEKERMPKEKACGDGLSWKTLALLRELKIEKEIERRPHKKIYGITVSSPEGITAEIPIEIIKGKPSGYVFKRKDFDGILFEKAKAFSSVKAIEGFEVKGLTEKKGKITGVKGIDPKGKEKEFHAKVIAGADGVNSLIAEKIRGREHDSKHNCIALRAYYRNVKGCKDKIEIHFIKDLIPGYFWVFPEAEGLYNVGLGIIECDMKKMGKNLREELQRIIKKEPLFKERFRNARRITPLKGWQLPFGSKKRKVQEKNCILLGDAAGLVDPFSGEGISNSVASGIIAAKVIGEALKEKNEKKFERKLCEYEKELWNELWPELKRSYRLQKAGKMKFLLNWIIRKANKSKKANELIAESLAKVQMREKPEFNLIFLLKVLFS